MSKEYYTNEEAIIKYINKQHKRYAKTVITEDKIEFYDKEGEIGEELKLWRGLIKKIKFSL